MSSRKKVQKGSEMLVKRGVKRIDVSAAEVALCKANKLFRYHHHNVSINQIKIHISGYFKGDI